MIQIENSKATLYCDRCCEEITPQQFGSYYRQHPGAPIIFLHSRCVAMFRRDNGISPDAGEWGSLQDRTGHTAIEEALRQLEA
jgi:hypothetical protein